MSIDEIHRFNKDVIETEALQEAIKDVGEDMAKLVSIAKEKGYDFTEDELKQAADSAEEELSDEDLEEVAGGFGFRPIIGIIVPVGIFPGGQPIGMRRIFIF